MENASKALIIAGAILIAIVLLTVGVVVVNSFNPDDAIGEVDQRTKEVFNSKFVSNSGTSVRGSAVKTLLSNVISSNSSNEASKQICVTYDDKIANKFASGTAPEQETKTFGTVSVTGVYKSNEISKISNKINAQHTYKVTLKYNTNGLVQKIELQDNG